MKFFTSILTCLIMSIGFAHGQDIADSSKVEMAVFPGGTEALYAYVSKNLVYPALAVENNISGKVMVEFNINQDGYVEDIRTIGPLHGFGLEEAAINVVKTMPRWEPAQMAGKPVKVRFRLPINFSLPEVPDKKRKTKKSTHAPPPPPEMREELKRNRND